MKSHYKTALHAIIEIANMHSPRSKEATAIVRIAENALDNGCSTTQQEWGREEVKTYGSMCKGDPPTKK